MSLLRSKRGQSTAEYAVLFAIVIGAAIAMQSVIQGRLKGAMNQYAANYSVQANATGNTKYFDPNRTTNSVSRTNMGMNSARKGNVNLISVSNTVSAR